MSIYLKNEVTSLRKGYIVTDDFQEVKVGCCRRCKQKIEPYEDVIVSVHYWVERVETEYSYQNSYCKDCALIKKKEDEKQPCIEPPAEVQRLQDGKGRVKHIYADGSIIEDWLQNDAQYFIRE